MRDALTAPPPLPFAPANALRCGLVPCSLNCGADPSSPAAFPAASKGGDYEIATTALDLLLQSWQTWGRRRRLVLWRRAGQLRSGASRGPGAAAERKW